MTETQKYNGWTNYETWNVKLWMDNEEPSYRYWREAAQEAYDNAEAQESDGGRVIFTREESATHAIRERMKDEYEQASCDLLERSSATASVWADLLGAALSEVNWHEIAEHLIEDVDKAE